jgi:hypothetical protein
MNASLAACVLVMSGWVSQDANEPVAPSPQNMQQPALRAPNYRPPARAMTNRPARPMGESNLQRRMPLSPTDPRVYSDSDMPLPPTMDSAGPMPSARMVDTRPRYVAVGSGEDANRRTLNEKPFEHHHNAPVISPYMLLYNNTANGTISTYNTYVRPALEQRASQQSEDALPGEGTPSYPPGFLTHEQYQHYPVAPDRQ